MKLDLYPLDQLLLKRKKLRRELSAVDGLQPIRIAILGGSTTNEVSDLIELYLLESRFLPTMYQSEYGRFYEEAAVDQSGLIEFGPDIVYIHTSYLDVRVTLPAQCSDADLVELVQIELNRYKRMWQSLEQNLSSQIIQNNFELPQFAPLGNFDVVSSGGSSRFFMMLNAEFSRAAAGSRRLLLQDIHRLSASLGLNCWHDRTRWFSYKMLTTPEANASIARSFTSIVRAVYGRSKKLLVLDLDNTLWGGVIGDDGVERIQIGRVTAIAEAYTAFQEYCLSLQKRGVLLAICSKNEENTARQEFTHPDSVLKLEHIASFKANWQPKHENILAIAKELNLSVESFVFVDDNPAERALVESQIHGIAVPDVDSDVSRFPSILEAARYFEAVSLSQEDLSRGALYQANVTRASHEATFSNYGEYLDSLEMCAEIGKFSPLYLERIAQLTNKTNQFNLTTKRYTLAEIEQITEGKHHIGLYGRLRDRFGDNGLISVVLGRCDKDVLHLELWPMSCRVLKRDMEKAILDALVKHARAANVQTIRGYYVPTRKNGMVADHYEMLGFVADAHSGETQGSAWILDVSRYTTQTQHITIVEPAHG